MPDIVKEQELAMTIAKMRGMEKERAPSIILDKCAVDAVLSYIERLEDCYKGEHFNHKCLVYQGL